MAYFRCANNNDSGTYTVNGNDGGAWGKASYSTTSGSHGGDSYTYSATMARNATIHISGCCYNSGYARLKVNGTYVVDKSSLSWTSDANYSISYNVSKGDVIVFETKNNSNTNFSAALAGGLWFSPRS